MVPTAILPLWLSALWSFGLLGGGAYLLHEWYERSWHFDPVRNGYIFRPILGGNTDTAFLVGGSALLLFATAGGVLVRPLLRALMRSAPTERVDEVAPPRVVGETKRIRRSDGSELQVESYGPEEGYPLVLTHGWGTNRREWEYLRREFAGSDCRLITWDLPGLGDSREPPGRDYRLENFASDLDSVLRETCGDRPAVLVGHSIGGMTILTFCRLFPEALGTRVAGLVLVHTTYTNPVRTVRNAALYTALEKPLLVPLLYLTIMLSPLLRLAGWLSYHNGSAHLNALVSGFAGTQSVEQLDFATRFCLQARPAVIARGMLGMLQYDATETLKTIAVPALIVSADRDTSCQPGASEQMARDIRDSRLVSLSPANHMGLLEHPQAFANSLHEFLDACFASRRIQPTGSPSAPRAKPK